MAQTSVSIRMDADLKRAFDEFCTEIGMTMTTAFCVFAKTAVANAKYRLRSHWSGAVTRSIHRATFSIWKS